MVHDVLFLQSFAKTPWHWEEHLIDAFLHLQANVVHVPLQWQKILFANTTFLATAAKLIFTDGSPHLTDPGYGISLTTVYLFCKIPNSVSNL